MDQIKKIIIYRIKSSVDMDSHYWNETKINALLLYRWI